MKLSGKALFEEKNLRWLKLGAWVVLLIIVFGYSAYFGAQQSMPRIAALETQQATLMAQLSQQSTQVAHIEIQMQPTPTVTSTTAATGHATVTPGRSCSMHGKIKVRQDYGTARLLQAPFLEAKPIVAMPANVQVEVCGRTDSVDYAEVRWQGNEGWIQTDWVDLPIGVTWVDIPVVH